METNGEISRKRLLLYLLLMVPLIKPDAISQWPSLVKLESVYSLMRVVSLLLIGILIIRECRTFKLTLYPVMVFASIMTLMASTFLHGQNVGLYVVGTWLSIAIATIVIEEGVQRNPTELLIAILMIMSSLLFINLVFLLLNPPSADADSLHVFLGQKNSVRNYAIPAVTIAFILSKRSRLYFYAGIVIAMASIFSQVISYSATGVVTTLLLLAICLNPILIRRVSGWLLALLPAIMNLIISILQIPILNELIQSLLNKEASFTGRDSIWRASIQCIKNSPYIGLGSGDKSLSRIVSSAANTSHNALLDITYQGGVIAFLSYASLYLMSFYQLVKNKLSDEYPYLLSGLLLFLISGVFENLNYFGFFLLVQLAYHVADLGQINERGKE